MSPDSTTGERAFAALQRLLPQHAMSRGMHALARSTRPWVRNVLLRSVLNAFPQIDMTEAVQPDPYAYPSFNAFFTRALRPNVRPIDPDRNTAVCPVDGTVSQAGVIDDDRLVQAKGIDYRVGELLGEQAAAARYRGGRFACLYLAPYNYHRIHSPLDAQLVRTRYLPGELFSVNAGTARTVPGLFARNERVVCEFDTAAGPLAMVLVGALFVGSVETVWSGEVNPPVGRGGAARDVTTGIGRSFAKGEEIARFNMGSTVIVLLGNTRASFDRSIVPDAAVRLGRALLRTAPDA